MTAEVFSRDATSGEAATARGRPAPEVGDYVLCGLRVRSALTLPEAVAWRGDDRTPDVTIRLGPAPAMTDPAGKIGVVQIGRDGACRVEAAAVACFHVAGGREVTVESHGDPGRLEVRAWLLGPVLGILCHQRALLPLHAACVRIGDGAVALAGRQGVGKSTLAAALAQRGHALVADDVCVIDPAGDPLVRPSFSRLKLWEDALRMLDVPVDGLPRPGSGRRKYHLCQFGSFDPSPVGLRAIYLLERATAPASAPDIRPLSGADAVVALSQEIYRPAIGFRLGRKAALLTAALRLASMVPVFRLPVWSDPSQLGAQAARLERHFSSLAGTPGVQPP